MRLFISICWILMLGISLSSCNYARVEDEEEKIFAPGTFDKLYVKGNFNILLEQGPQSGLRIRGLKETLETVDVKSDPSTGWLRLTRDKFSLNSPRVILRFLDLNQIRIEGGATIKTDGYLDLQDLAVSVEGGANIKMKMKARKLDLSGEGGVVYELQGVSRQLTARLSGASYLKASEFETDTADIHIEGVGFAAIHVNQYLNARLEGMGKISYSGTPQVNQSVDGLGTIEQQ
ncbi:putative autotransporter adhesin-like protein [Mangrovibacterium marinum]|uniref:Putative autotransporter adhesin-like protein n=2 Tax=Mangrovibacterium marinum TaxID=1639118 RepID=A0A2T5C547_9BACT|nr:putative autotransporter adhesin-like protein [Mangrovibacterium marinum]